MGDHCVVFDIKKFSIHDGPGIRTTVFFKGCPLRCAWCHNPESQRSAAQLMFHPERCIGCGECVEVCPHGAITQVDGRVTNSPARCVHCGACVRACYAEARELIGRRMSIAELLDTINRDRPFYERSQGGVTISGGEPLHQPKALLTLLQACQAQAISTAVDTCGYAPWSALERILPYTDLFLYDLKHMDDDRHRALTGISNQRLLANLRCLAERGAAIWVRMPLIPGINDNVPHLRRVRDFVTALPGVHRLDILPYHPTAQEKYQRLDLDYTLADLAPPSDEHVQHAADILRTTGLTVTIGG